MQTFQLMIPEDDTEVGVKVIVRAKAVVLKSKPSSRVYTRNAIKRVIALGPMVMRDRCANQGALVLYLRTLRASESFRGFTCHTGTDSRL